jgi:ankyrin repeat protein
MSTPVLPLGLATTRLSSLLDLLSHGQELADIAAQQGKLVDLAELACELQTAVSAQFKLDVLGKHAVWSGDARVVTQRLRNGEAVDWAARKDGFPPLHWAIYKGRTAIVQLLLAAGADVGGGHF